MILVTVRAAAAPHLQALLRIVVGLLFFEHGSAKLVAFPFVPGMSEAPLHALPLFTGAMELVGGALIVVGLFTSPVAFLLSGYMAVAYFWAHFPAGFFPILNHGEPAILYCFVFLYLAAAGPGAWAVDKDRLVNPPAPRADAPPAPKRQTTSRASAA